MNSARLFPRMGALLLSPAWLLFQTQRLWAQQLGQGRSEGEIGLWQVAGALTVCIAVAVAAAFILRSRMQGGAILRLRHTRRLQLVETLRVGTQTDICIVSCDGEEMLIASSSRNVQLLRPTVPYRDNPTP